MRLIIPLVIFPLLTVTAQAAEIRLECRNYGSMETFAENHVKLRPAETEKQVQTCLATGQSYSHIQYISFDDENLAGKAKMWSKPCWSGETPATQLNIAVLPDLTMSFLGENRSAFNVNMKTNRGGYRSNRDYLCEIIDASKTGVESNSLTEYKKAADQNDAEAQYVLAQKYHFEWGVPKDHSKAEKWYRKAAEQGHAKAQYNLGTLYSRGQGVSIDHAGAAKWYQQAANQGHAEAQYNLGYAYQIGRGISENKSEAAKWYQQAAEQGHINAQVSLSRLYFLGEGLTKNDTEGLNWLRKAAEQGHADSQHVLGGRYYRGRGVPQNDAEAFKWYRKAAVQGYAKSQYSTGFMYAQGRGVPEDLNEALKWHRRAADQGYEPSITTLKKIGLYP